LIDKALSRAKNPDSSLGKIEPEDFVTNELKAKKKVGIRLIKTEKNGRNIEEENKE